ncbi:hypothetical protein M885DRAFT_511184 [Pelagophyceae sp. CCMP2097]|nr:hypothetical protein M885DRAFT_511184 [Pelagophyceae sp. CCMP2097]|mmetsp:Transcript_31540/g.106212  ORF Transcript_31540/g.106212 Transcript_31540/m.106212 type:complete len:205 (-) Transcript_31540:40-654(-)
MPSRLLCALAWTLAAALHAPRPGALRRCRPKGVAGRAPLRAVDSETDVAVSVEPATANATATAVANATEIELGQLDQWLVNWGLKEDPRVPEELRLTPIQRIKSSGRAGVSAYALTEGVFWLSSVPLALAAIRYETGALPDVATTEGQTAVAEYVVAFTTFARVLVPARIALALALAPWCDRNIIQKFFPALPTPPAGPDAGAE